MGGPDGGAAIGGGPADRGRVEGGLMRLRLRRPRRPRSTVGACRRRVALAVVAVAATAVGAHRGRRRRQRDRRTADATSIASVEPATWW